MSKITKIVRVTKENSAQEIAEAILRLSEREKIKACKICRETNCRDCLAHWYCARNAAIRILRNIFDLPTNKDVPKSIFHAASNEADNILYGHISKKLLLNIERIKTADRSGILIDQIPKDVICDSCGKEVPPSRAGYVINGNDPVCWDCELKRCGMEQTNTGGLYDNVGEI